jgi:hypothetical protein
MKATKFFKVASSRDIDRKWHIRLTAPNIGGGDTIVKMECKSEAHASPTWQLL